ncbi:MAG: TolC family protein [Tenuifilaceae bacterium]|nr:TolC family protein [Tenuifilaceae bacterium]
MFNHIGFKILIIGLAPLLLGVSSAHGQDTLRLNLDKALEIALSENPTIKLADKEIERTQYYRREMLGGFYPSLSGSAQYMRNIEPQVIFMPEGVFGPGTGGPMKIGFDNSYTAGLSLSVPLVAPSLFKMLRISETDIEIALEKSRESKLNMASEVKKAFYNLLLAQNSYDVMSMSMENAQKNLQNIKNLYSQGLVAEYDVIRSEVQVRNLNPTFVQAENAVNLSAMMLKILLGVGTDLELVIEGDLSDYEDELAQGIPGKSLMLNQNTTLRQLELQELKLSQQFQLVRTTRMPMLAAFGNYQYLSQANDFKFADYNWVSTNMVGLQLQVPIFQGFTNKYKEQQILVGIDQLKIQRDYLNQNLTLQARNAITSMMRAAEQISSSKEGIAQAERGYSIAQTRYSTGSGTILELNDAEVSLTQAKLNYNQAVYDFLQAKVDYESILGDEQIIAGKYLNK